MNRGDHVKQGQLVAALENRDLAAAVDNAKGQVAQAAVNLNSVANGHRTRIRGEGPDRRGIRPGAI